MKTNLLFTYGTLLQPNNKIAAYLRANSVFYGKGEFKGTLYDFGAYPGAFYNPKSTGCVFGVVLQLNHPAETLKILDSYEGFGEDEPKPNLFVRKQIAVQSSGVTVNCWVYLYNLPIDGALRILSGDYLAYNAK